MNASRLFAPRTLGILSVACALIALSGCRSYRLGHPASLPYNTIFVEVAGNESYAPKAQALVSSNLRQAIIRDSRTQLVAAAANADVVLEVTLVDYEKDAGTRNPNDTTVALDYEVTLIAEVSLYDQASGTYLFKERRVYEKSNVFVANIYAEGVNTQGFTQAEYQAMSQISRDLAQKIANEVLGAW